MADVPTARKTSQSVAALARATTAGSRVSPNQTTAGLARPPQCGHAGTLTAELAEVAETILPCVLCGWRGSSSHGAAPAAHGRAHRTCQIEPCILTTSFVPAAS